MAKLLLKPVSELLLIESAVLLCVATMRYPLLSGYCTPRARLRMRHGYST